MVLQNEVEIVVKGIELSWTTWGKMQGEKLVLDDISYVKAENGKGFERIFSIKINENQDFRVQQMISMIKARIMPDAMLIMPDTKPENLAQILSEKGFIINDKDPCMVLYLDNYNDRKTEKIDFSVIKITEKSQLAEWLNILNIALFECEFINLEQLNGLLYLNNVNFYLGLLGGKPISTCMTITEDDTSVLEMVATLKEYRRKGYASALIEKALMDLKQKDIKSVSLRSEPDGVGVYKKLGFNECFNRVIATCDWNKVYKEACPCYMADEKIVKAKQIFNNTNDVEEFVSEMKKQDVIGKDIKYESQENAIYITKKYACDNGLGCPSNDTLIGQRCHCEYVNHLTQYVPISYCKCSAIWFEPMFFPIFGEKIIIEPVKTVLSGAEECIFRIKL